MSALPPRGNTTEKVQKRIAWLNAQLQKNIALPPPTQPEDLKGIIENFVGYLSIPMAYAGPLLIHGDYAKGTYYMPLCTVEGSLILSATRGLYLCTKSGGITTRHIKQNMTRSPFFVFNSITQTKPFLQWVNTHYNEIKQAAESTTNHGKLTDIKSRIFHNRVILDFCYTTGEAAGQNMTTISTANACQYIDQNYRADNPFRYVVEGNFNCDKNPGHKSISEGRGHYVIAEVLLKNTYLKKFFRSSIADFMFGYRQQVLGSQLAGTLGCNLHHANALTATYIALGQDTACVAENAVGFTDYEPRGEDIYVTLTLPSLSIGTVGGGTKLAQQQYNLSLLGCIGENSSKKLAELIAATTLALELSLGGAISSHEFATAHSQYGR